MGGHPTVPTTALSVSNVACRAVQSRPRRSPNLAQSSVLNRPDHDAFTGCDKASGRSLWNGNRFNGAGLCTTCEAPKIFTHRSLPMAIGK